LCHLNIAVIYQSLIFYSSLDLISFAEADLYAMYSGGAATVATYGQVEGNLLSAGALATAAHSKVYGKVSSVGVLSKGAFNAGASSKIFGDIDSEGAVTIYGLTSLSGVIINSMATTIAPNADMFPVPKNPEKGITYPEPPRLPSLQLPLIYDTLSSRYINLLALDHVILPVTEIAASTSAAPFTLAPGVYRHPAAFSFGTGLSLIFDNYAADRTSNGKADDTWIIQVIGAGAFAGKMTLGTNIVASNIIWYIFIVFKFHITAYFILTFLIL
jgi:hypothetical protein